MLTVAPAARAQASLPDLSLEDLMKLDAGQVFGASQRLQPATEAPAAVSFITAEEIRRYGYRTLADILRAVRGMYVTDDRNFSLLGAQGFAKPGDYNSRILLLVNGHRVNDNVFGQAEIGTEFGMDPAMFERVEIIRGPASSLYGDSAFFAVVNVITRSGSSLGGASITLEGGSLGTELVRASLGQRLKNGLDIAVSATRETSDGVKKLYFPEFDSPATNNGIAENLDGEAAKQFYSRLSFKGLTVTAAYGTRRRDVPTASFGTLFNEHDWREQTTDRHTLIDAEYLRSFKGTNLTFRASYDRFTYDGIYPFEGDAQTPSPIVGKNSVIGSRWSLGSGMTKPLAWRQTVRAGVEFINNLDQDQVVRYLIPPYLALDKTRSSTQQAAYFEDEIKLSQHFIVNAGLRYDRYSAFQSVTPRTAFIFMPSATQSFKYLYGRAFRAPNAYELNDFYFGESVYDLRPELVDTHQFVWENYVNEWLRTSASTYWYKANRLITAMPADTLLGTTFVNQGEVRARGLEFEAQMRLKWGWQALTSYAVQNAIDQETHDQLPNSPRHMVKARLSVPGPLRGSFISLEGQYLSKRGTLSGSNVPAYGVGNVNYVQAIGPSWELYAGVRNIFDTQILDPASNSHRQDAIPRNGRTVRFGVRFKLWSK
jgi:outer membrane receptor for ferrienterochelin and colicins